MSDLPVNQLTSPPVNQSTSPPANQLPPQLLQPAVRAKLSGLRWMLRCRLAAEGLAIMLMALVAAVLVSLGMDYTLRLDRPLRIALTAICGCLIGWVGWRQMLAPLMSPLRDEDLALLIERKWHDLRDSLISTIQFGRTRRLPIGASVDMIVHTARKANELTMALPFGQVLERRRFWRLFAASLAAVVLLGGIGAATAKSGTMALWFKRNVLMTNDAWPQDTYLKVQGNDFEVLRGDDLSVVVVVVEGSQAPAWVTYHANYPSVGMTEERVDVSPDGKTYEKKFQAVSEEFSFYVTGGDDKTDKAHPHSVSLVDAPMLIAPRYRIVYPAYMNLPDAPQRNLDGVLGAPLGSTVTIAAQSSKDLESAAVEIDDKPAGSTRLSGQRDVLCSFVVEGKNVSAMRKLRVLLKDTAGYSNRRQQPFQLHVQNDLAPNVIVRSFGVGPNVTPNAIIPLSINVRDDNGVARLQAGAIIPPAASFAASLPASAPTSQAADVVLANVAPPPGGQKEFNAIHKHDLEKSATAAKVGDLVQILVEAQDTMDGDLGGPNRKRSVAEFHIISAEDVRVDLTRRQKEISMEFAQAILAQNTLVAQAAAMTTELAAGRVPDNVRVVAAAGVKGQTAVGSDCSKAAELLQVIHDEMVNNRVFKSSEHDYLSGEIIEPLRKLGGPISEASAGLNKTVSSIDAGATDAAGLNVTAGAAFELQQTILQEMKAIHERMRKLESRQDFINQVIALQGVWQHVANQTKDLERQQAGRLMDSASQAVSKPASRPASKPGRADWEN